MPIISNTIIILERKLSRNLLEFGQRMNDFPENFYNVSYDEIDVFFNSTVMFQTNSATRNPTSLILSSHFSMKNISVDRDIFTLFGKRKKLFYQLKTVKYKQSSKKVRFSPDLGEGKQEKMWQRSTRWRRRKPVDQ